MKLACSSSSFDGHIRSGELTQLEWIDLCARELATDGVVLDVRHFPRTDTDYLAQVKKMAVDLGLCVAALYDAGFFASTADQMELALTIAQAVGAPLLAAPMERETSATWSDALVRLSEATSLAKRLNVTLALRNAPFTFAAGVHDMKRVGKEADSAWLRYGPDYSAFDAASEPDQITSKVVLAWQSSRSGQAAAARTAALLHGFRGFVVIEDPAGSADHLTSAAAFAAWRAVTIPQQFTASA